MHVSSIRPVDRTLSGATTLSQSGPGSNSNEGGTPHLPMLQHYWNLTIRLFSVIFRTPVGGGSYPSAEKQLVYSTAPTDWASGYYYCYLILIILLNTIHLHSVKWFQVLLCIAKNSIIPQSFVYTQFKLSNIDRVLSMDHPIRCYHSGSK